MTTWRTIMTDSESLTGVAPTCPDQDDATKHNPGFDGDPADATGVYDCCPGPHIEVWSEATAETLAETLTAGRCEGVLVKAEQYQQIVETVLLRARDVESGRRELLPLNEAHDQVQGAAADESMDPDSADNQFADALVELAANCIVRIIDHVHCGGAVPTAEGVHR
jgi:hypothetical protein